MIRNFCVICLLSCTIARGQSVLSASAAESPAATPNPAHAVAKIARIPQFDAASIKLAAVRDQQINAIYAYPGGRIFCAHCTLQFLTTLAFDLPDWQVTGRAEWMNDARFDLDAKTSERSQPTTWNSKTPLTDEQRQMLQALLMDRFRLGSYRETRTDTVYILKRSDQPLKLVLPLHPWEAHSVGGAGGGSIGGATGIAGKSISMHELATRISSVLKRPVVDQTGLPGTFDFVCRPSDTASGEVTDTVFDSMRGIGLKLTPAIGPVEMLVIDHAEPPTENEPSTIYTRNPGCPIACPELVEGINERP
jgi:uncharacterized protein (TIGR03435 family)